MELNQKIEAVRVVDSLFDDYQVAVKPGEAAEFVLHLSTLGKATPTALRKLVDGINAAVPKLDFGADSPATGRAGHGFQIGRKRGRTLVVELLRSYFPAGTDYEVLQSRIDYLADRAGCNHVSFCGDETADIIEMIWD